MGILQRRHHTSPVPQLLCQIIALRQQRLMRGFQCIFLDTPNFAFLIFDVALVHQLLKKGLAVQEQLHRSDNFHSSSSKDNIRLFTAIAGRAFCAF